MWDTFLIVSGWIMVVSIAPFILCQIFFIPIMVGALLFGNTDMEASERRVTSGYLLFFAPLPSLAWLCMGLWLVGIL